MVQCRCLAYILSSTSRGNLSTLPLSSLEDERHIPLELLIEVLSFDSTSCPPFSSHLIKSSAPVSTSKLLTNPSFPATSPLSPSSLVSCPPSVDLHHSSSLQYSSIRPSSLLRHDYLWTALDSFYHPHPSPFSLICCDQRLRETLGSSRTFSVSRTSIFVLPTFSSRATLL